MSNPRNIILAGFMGTGKTTVGQLVADFIGWHFVDTDAEIVERVGLTIPEIFGQQGEAGFRRYERIVCQSIAARDKQVIATGGGMIVDPKNRDVLAKSGLLVCLSAPPEVIKARIEGESGRPLAKNWTDLLEKRQVVYDSLPYQIDTDELSPQEVAEKVIALWQTSSM